MQTIPKKYAISLLERSALMLSCGTAQAQALSDEIGAAIKPSLFAKKAAEFRAENPVRTKAERRPYPISPESQRQREQVAAMLGEGAPIAAIAAHLGKTRQRIDQIVKKLGLKRARMPSTKTADALAARRAASDARCMEAYGVDYLGAKALIAAGVMTAFRSQKQQAQSRLIPWELTFIQWHQIWLASGVFDKRGRGKGRYVMAREGGVGAYADGNVKIISYEDNIREVRARTYGSVSEHTGVYLMYPGLKNPWAARARGKAVGNYATHELATAARQQAMGA